MGRITMLFVNNNCNKSHVQKYLNTESTHACHLRKFPIHMQGQRHGVFTYNKTELMDILREKAVVEAVEQKIGSHEGVIVRLDEKN